MISGLDDSVGRILAKLDELSIADRTAVFFMSDNGGVVHQGKQPDIITSNAPLRAGKGHVYEGGIREPMMIRWPRVTQAGDSLPYANEQHRLLPDHSRHGGRSGGTAARRSTGSA